MSIEQAALVVAAVAVVLTAILVFQGVRSRNIAKRSDKAAERRWEASIRPRPKVGFSDPSQMFAPGPAVTITASNQGGAITSGLVVAHVRDRLYIGGILMPAQAPATTSTLLPIAGAFPEAYWNGNMVSEIIAVYAVDVEGGMWECRHDLSLDAPMPGPGAREFLAWLETVRARARAQTNKPDADEVQRGRSSRPPILKPKPEDVTEEDLLVRARGSQFVAQLMFKTFARPGVRHIVSRGEQRTPARIDFKRPEERTVRSTDLPVTISGEHGVFVVLSIVPGGFVIREEDSAGEEVDSWLYFDS